VASVDPNNIEGPSGYGPKGFVQPELFSYGIEFQNKPTATAPAQVVVVTQQIDSNLDWSTFQLGNIAFGDTVIDVPAGQMSYSTQVDLTATLGIDVDVTADFNPVTGLATWTFTSIDPTTLDVPSNPLEGFLPPDKVAGEGEGFVNYSILPKASATTGTPINAKATVVFDANTPLSTANFLNTLDVGPVTSQVTPLPAQSPATFTVSWSPTDAPGGSGIATYNVFVSDDGGAFKPFVTSTTATSASFTGQVGHTYGFYSVATDHVGNVQPTPTASQAKTTVSQSSPVVVATTTTLSSSVSSTVFGQSVTFTAVINTQAAELPLPTGMVSFLDGSNLLANVAVNAGVARYTTGVLPLGTQSIQAVYAGDATHTGIRSGTAGLTVHTDASTVAVLPSANPASPNHLVTLTAIVTAAAPGNGTPTGTVVFYNGKKALGTATLNGGMAAITTKKLTLGSHTIKVIYHGDSDFTGSTSAGLREVIKKPARVKKAKVRPAVRVKLQTGVALDVASNSLVRSMLLRDMAMAEVIVERPDAKRSP
jgi:hypothetical protein